MRRWLCVYLILVMWSVSATVALANQPELPLVLSLDDKESLGPGVSNVRLDKLKVRSRTELAFLFENVRRSKVDFKCHIEGFEYELRLVFQWQL